MKEVITGEWLLCAQVNEMLGCDDNVADYAAKGHLIGGKYSVAKRRLTFEDIQRLKAAGHTVHSSSKYLYKLEESEVDDGPPPEVASARMPDGSITTPTVWMQHKHAQWLLGLSFSLTRYARDRTVVDGKYIVERRKATDEERTPVPNMKFVYRIVSAEGASKNDDITKAIFKAATPEDAESVPLLLCKEHLDYLDTNHHQAGRSALVRGIIDALDTVGVSFPEGGQEEFAFSLMRDLGEAVYSDHDAKLRQEVAQLRAKIAATSEAVRSAKGEASGHKRWSDKYKFESEQLQALCTSLKDEVAAKDGQIAELEAQIEEWKVASGRDGETINALESEIMELEAQKDRISQALTERLKAAERLIDSRDKRITANAKGIQRLMGERAEARAEAKLLQYEEQLLNAKISELEAKFAEASKEFDALKVSEAYHRNRCEQLEVELRGALDGKCALSELSDKLQHDLDDACDKIDEWQARAERAEADLENMRKNWRVNKADREASIRVLRAYLDDATDRLDDREDWKREVDSLRVENEALHRQVEREAQALASALDEAKRLRDVLCRVLVDNPQIAVELLLESK